jgi:hypothetical protein
VNQSKPQSTLKQSTKVCDCGNTVLVLLTSLNKKYCIDCQKYIDWYLAEGQKSPLTSVIGGPSTPLIQDPTSIVESLPAGATMNDKTYLISLDDATELDVRTLCAVFSEVHDVDVPEEFIQEILVRKDVVPDLYIQIEHKPLSIGLCTDESPTTVMPIELCIQIYRLVAQGAGLSVKKPQTISVQEAAEEYVELWKTLVAVANRLGIKPIQGGRVANVKNMLQVMEQNFKPPTTH